QLVAFAISASVAPSLRLIRSRTIWALLPDFAVPFPLVSFAFFFGVVSFFAFADFLRCFFGVACSTLVVVSCVLIVVLLIRCIGRHIHRSGSKGNAEAKNRRNGSIQK